MTWNTIRNQDCIAAMAELEPGSVDLVFADPPFNIGYDYDVYQDRKSADEYLNWSKAWMAGVSRVLKPTGTFWLAIGDEFAAELKVLATRELGFVCRSWVVWYYTFGVNCKRKFTRSHAHLFHFVKDGKQFTFNDEAIRVPSARQLVYADTRANPQGRLPDDTWILRPQDAPQSFTPTESTWYFPRVAGLRHLQGTGRFPWLPDAGAASGADHSLLLEPRRAGARSLCRQRQHAGRRQEAGPAMAGLRRIGGVRARRSSSTRGHSDGRSARWGGRPPRLGAQHRHGATGWSAAAPSSAPPCRSGTFQGLAILCPHQRRERG
ncbi:MAG TPA: site-specific DNA-methyltransferase [Gemmatales bacterium]|nr:site-specific DNA-methyltransferase [Gemmatales bacterium]